MDDLIQFFFGGMALFLLFSLLKRGMGRVESPKERWTGR